MDMDFKILASLKVVKVDGLASHSLCQYGVDFALITHDANLELLNKLINSKSNSPYLNCGRGIMRMLHYNLLMSNVTKHNYSLRLSCLNSSVHHMSTSPIIMKW